MAAGREEVAGLEREGAEVTKRLEIENREANKLQNQEYAI